MDDQVCFRITAKETFLNCLTPFLEVCIHQRLFRLLIFFLAREFI